MYMQVPDVACSSITAGQVAFAEIGKQLGIDEACGVPDGCPDVLPSMRTLKEHKDN